MRAWSATTKANARSVRNICPMPTRDVQTQAFQLVSSVTSGKCARAQGVAQRDMLAAPCLIIYLPALGEVDSYKLLYGTNHMFVFLPTPRTLLQSSKVCATPHYWTAKVATPQLRSAKGSSMAHRLSAASGQSASCRLGAGLRPSTPGNPRRSMEACQTAPPLEMRVECAGGHKEQGNH